MLFLLFFELHAKDLGTYGTTFPIQEENFIDVLQARIVNFEEQNGAVFIADKLSKGILNPKGISLPKATAYRSFIYDPSFLLAADIEDHEGTIIAHKGTTVNPLTLTPLTKSMVFFDGSDNKQTQWALQQTNSKLILTNGNLLELEKKYQQPFYFDQAAYLINKLGIQHLPAIVKQENDHLKIEEIPCF